MTGEPLDPQNVTCAEIDERELLADYAAGQLPDAERDAVEVHLIQCGRCASELEALLAAREELTVLSEEPTAAPRSHSAMTTIAVGLLLTAATLALVLAIPRGAAVRPIRPSTSSGRTDPQLLALARVDPPSYTPFTVRSADEAAARFNDAMGAYARRDFRTAAAGLRAVVAADAANVQAQFYLGASLLTLGDASAAAERFRLVITAGASPFHDSAQLLLGKALIATGDLDGASITLRAASHGTGPRAAEAAQLGRQLDGIRASRRR